MEVTRSFLLQHPSVKETKSWEGKEVSSKAEPNEGVTHRNLLVFFKITTSVSFLSLTVISHRVPCRVPSCKKKKKKVCLFSRAGYQRPSWGKKKLLWKDTGYSKCSSPSKTWALFFFYLILHLGILNIRAKTQCLLPAVILLCWWEKNETETRKPCVRKKKLSKHPEKTSHVYFMFVKLYVTCVISELLWQWPILFPLVVQVIYIWSSLPSL